MSAANRHEAQRNEGAPPAGEHETGAGYRCPAYLADPDELRQALDAFGAWYPCEEPERPPDPWMVVIEGCEACAIADKAATLRYGEPRVRVDTEEDAHEAMRRIGSR